MDDMTIRPAGEEHSLRGYFSVSRTATYGFLTALPLLVVYEVLIVAANRDAVHQIRISAEVWMKSLFALTGLAGSHILAVAVLVVGIIVIAVERRKKIPLRPKYFTFMICESAVYAAAVALLISRITTLIFGAAPAAAQMEEQSQLMQLTLSVGAGVYEELLFRVILVGGLFMIFKRLLSGKRAYVYILAAVIGALVFSAVHYTGAMGDEFEVSSFFFRALFGIALNALYLFRGFGIAAWTHALYDILVVLVLS